MPAILFYEDVGNPSPRETQGWRLRQAGSHTLKEYGTRATGGRSTPSHVKRQRPQPSAGLYRHGGHDAPRRGGTRREGTQQTLLMCTPRSTERVVRRKTRPQVRRRGL